MHAVTEHAPSPLIWVSDELHRAFAQAHAALAEATDAPVSNASLHTAQTHLHEADGALAIVGLDAACAFTTALSDLLGRMARNELDCTADHLDIVRRALTIIDNHIEELAAGKSDNPRRLLAQYEIIEQALGREPDPLDLFHPDVTQRRTPRAVPANAALTPSLRRARAEFERGLLRLLRDPEQRDGAAAMRGAAGELARVLPYAAQANLWRAAEGFLDLAAHAAAPDPARIQPLCTALAKILRQLSAGHAVSVEPLTRKILFEIARSTELPACAAETARLFELDRVWPRAEFEPHLDTPLRPLRTELDTHIAQISQSWERFSGGEAAALITFHDGLQSLAQRAEALGNPGLTQLLDGIQETVLWLREDPLRCDDVVAAEVATALLLVASATHPAHDAASLATQTDDACARLAAVRAGTPLPAITSSPAAAAKRAHYQEDARRHTAREIRNSLALVEQTLDEYFRAPQHGTALTGLVAPMAQIAGALQLLGDDRAMRLAQTSGAAIAAIARQDTPPDATAFESIARALSTLGLLIDELEHGRPHPAKPSEPQPVAPSPAIERPATGTPAASAPASAAKPAPAPPAAQGAPQADPEVDAELLAIFLEEAHQVLAHIAEQHDVLDDSPDALIEIRRGIHTLKGSGRMVGLDALGEAAWAVEQTLNRWLQLELPIEPPLRAFIKRAHEEFSRWIAEIEQHGAIEHDASALVAQAEQLRATTDATTPSDSEADNQTAAPAALTEPEPHADLTPEPTLEAEDSEPEPSAAPAPAPAPAIFDFGDLPLAAENDTQDSATQRAPDPIAPDEASALEPQPEATATVRLGSIELARPLFELYLSEARTHIEQLRSEIQDAQMAAQVSDFRPTDTALRAIHTLAGISATTHLAPVHELARALEVTLERLRRRPDTSGNAGATIDTAIATLDAMLAELAEERMPLDAPALIDTLEHLGKHHDTGPAETAATTDYAAETSAEALPTLDTPTPVQNDLDPQLLPIFLDEAQELLASLHASLREWRAGAPGAHPHVIARALHTLKGSARMSGAMVLGEHIHILESHLENAALHSGDPAPLIETLINGLDAAENVLASLTHGETAAPATEAASAPGDVSADLSDANAAADATDTAPGSASLRIQSDTLDRFINTAGEIGIARTRIDGALRTVRRSLLDLTENIIRLRNQLREIELQAETQMQSRLAQTDAAHDEFDPLEMDRYTRLQELTRFMAESVGDVTTVQQNLLHNLDGAELALHGQGRYTRELQQALMQVRMVPFDSLADRLHRVVRQTAKDLQRRVNLDIHGGRIEIDRGVLERMTAALEHLLRNAVGHGIEEAQTRQATGKNPLGQITLSLTQQGNEFLLELADDGRGLDLHAIAERARALGLLDDATSGSGDRDALAQLIFTPGFSTVSNVSTVAGRGIGMDVVKADVAALGGRIELDTQVGRGTRFRIFLPLSLAVTQALLVRAGETSYAIPSNLIAQVLELRSTALDGIRNSGEVEWQGQHFPYHYLPHLLGEPHAQPENQRFSWVLLLRAGDRSLALHVDALRSNEEIVVKDAGPQLMRIVGFSGATLLGDGEIVLILNPIALASRTPLAGPEEATLPADAPIDDPVRGHVLIVDDSLTVRKITGRLFEREGYRVITAKDGNDALEQMEETLPDIVLSDIEMPRMDGFDLLRSLRADERTAHLPVIMITSRLATKHRDHAFKLGANAYLGKPYDEDELLALVARHSHNASRRPAQA